MITAPEVFEDTHLPTQYPHRDPELNHLQRHLAPATTNEPTADLLISGPSGVGKTSLARYVLTNLSKQAPIQTAHVRCLGQTTGQILRDIQRSLTGESVPKNRPVDEVQDSLHETLVRPTIVILDEADELPHTEVLSRLERIRYLSTIVIIHDPTHWLSRVATDVAHRLGGDTHVELDRYTAAELADILEDRATRGLHPHAVTRVQLERIADGAAGVARRGIQALRAAAELASEREHERIREPDIDACFERARRRIREANLTSLPFHHQVLYALIYEVGEISSQQLHERYTEVAEAVYTQAAVTPIGQRARREKLRKLRSYDLVEQEGVKRWRRYAVADRAVEPTVELTERPAGPLSQN